MDKNQNPRLLVQYKLFQLKQKKHYVQMQARANLELQYSDNKTTTILPYLIIFFPPYNIILFNVNCFT